MSAHLSQDEKLIELLINGYDAHGFVAKLVFHDVIPDEVSPNDVKKLYGNLRNIAKSIGFAMDYGGSEYTVSKNLGIEKKEALKYIDNYYNGFSGLKAYGVKLKNIARKTGYVETLLGRRRHVKGINDSNMKISSYYERTCLNAPQQGSAADVPVNAQINIEHDPVCQALDAKMLLQVHDELVFSIPKKYAHLLGCRLAKLMEDFPVDLTIPLKACWDLGRTYAEAK